MSDLENRLSRATARFEQHLGDELQWGELATEPPTTWLGNAARRFRTWLLELRLGRQPELWQSAEEYDAELSELNEQTLTLLKQRIADQVTRTLDEHRRDLAKFLRSIRSRSSTRQERLFGEIDPRLLFRTFPVWLTTIADAAELVPMETEIFDLAIFDEATQCDMASCLPILQRARRALVVGDPNQLRHVSFLADDTMRYLADEHGLDHEDRKKFHYRNKSLLDLVDEHVDSQRQVQFLDEHFRSVPAIIEFSNQQFYHGSLSLMRKRPSAKDSACLFPCFMPHGKKQGGANPVEAEAVVEQIARMVESQAALPPAACQSIGVLSPFRDQVDLIAEHLQSRLSLDELSRHDLRVGTAHAFQGDERDVMLLSLVVDDNTHSAAVRFLNQPEVLNVSITRARNEQYVYYSCQIDQLATNSLVRKYLEYIESPPAQAETRSQQSADFLGSVQRELEQQGYSVWPEYAIAGTSIDLVVEHQGRLLGIDLIGTPGLSGAALDLERYRVLRRAGLKLMPLAYRPWQSDRTGCLRAIAARLGSEDGSV